MDIPAIRGLDDLREKVQTSPDRLIRLLRELLEETKERWLAAAKRRVPVDLLGKHPGQLRDSIAGMVEQIGNELFLSIGTDVPYAPHVEWGTDRIAGGDVKALGDTPYITDAESIKEWPAKTERGTSNDMMPWLRPSWWEIEPWFREQLGYILLNSLTGGTRK